MPSLRLNEDDNSATCNYDVTYAVETNQYNNPANVFTTIVTSFDAASSTLTFSSSDLSLGNKYVNFTVRAVPSV